MTDSPCVWTPDRLIRYPLITDLALSKDGQTVAYAVREPLLDEDRSKFVTHLCRASIEDGNAIRLTYGDSSNSAPHWSPDGRHLAFLSDRDGGVGNIYVMQTAGGEAWALTRAEKDVGSFEWSPDGKRLAFTMVPEDSEERKTAVKAGDDVVRWDVDHERASLWVTDLTDGGRAPATPTQVTEGDVHVKGYAWFEHGQSLAVIHQPSPSGDVWPQSRLGIAEPSADGYHLLDVAHVGTDQPTCKVHGRQIACSSLDTDRPWIIRERVIVCSADGDAAIPLGRTPDSRPYVIDWKADGSCLYVLENEGTGSAILALPTDGSEPRALLKSAGFLSQVQTDGQGTFVGTTQDTDQPNRVAVLRAGDSAWRDVVAPPMPDWPAGREPETRLLRWRSDDGLDIEGILTLPLGYKEGKAYPTLVAVHGGPMSVFSRTYVAGGSLYPLVSFCERGYAVLRVNPRGSGGYGATFREANSRDWGGGDYRDIMSGLDLIIAEGIADPDRLGIMGWSYGGFMTSWTITQTSRFRAASVGAAVTDLVSFTGTSDISSFLPHYMGSEFWQDLEVYRTHSAMFNVEGVTTPALIQHGEEDVRVPLGQGMELYNALKRQGVPVEMDIYPRQRHGPTEPRIILDIMRRNLEWFDRWLMQDPDDRGEAETDSS